MKVFFFWAGAKAVFEVVVGAVVEERGSPLPAPTQKLLGESPPNHKKDQPPSPSS